MKAVEGLERSLGCRTISQLRDSMETSQLIDTLAMISNVKEILTKKKSQLMAFALIEDGSSSMEAVFFPEVYEKVKSFLLQTGGVFHITGQLQKKEGALFNQLVVENIRPLDDFLKSIQKIQFNLSPDMGKDALYHLKSILSESKKGASLVSLKVSIPNENYFVEMDTKDLNHIEVNHVLLQKARKIFKTSKNIHLYR